jgi:thiamine-monophosphate kinase
METEFISWLRSRVASHPRVSLGIGDDAAVLQLGGADCVVTTDMLTDGVDFDVDLHAPSRIGHKALAVSLSDIAAMAAEPVAAFVSLLVPKSSEPTLAARLLEGMIPLAESLDVAIAGGDTNTWKGKLVINTTLVGKTTGAGPLTRGGARPGDWIVVTGALGGSILGRHLDVRPRVREILELRKHYAIHAGIDVSDGLAFDLSRIAQESQCGVVVELDAIPIHNDARRLVADKPDLGAAVDHALGDGEDFELILAVAPDVAARMIDQQPLEIPLTRIGRFVDEPGMWQTDARGLRAPLPAIGFQHKLGE